MLSATAADCRRPGLSQPYDQLKLHRLSLDEIRKTRRALRFVFANVCSPVELPF
jgi:hypothetical protein